MIQNIQDAKKIAEILLNINAVKLQPSSFFTWASGKKSPIYCDNRLLLLLYRPIGQNILGVFVVSVDR